MAQVLEDTAIPGPRSAQLRQSDRRVLATLGSRWRMKGRSKHHCWWSATYDGNRWRQQLIVRHSDADGEPEILIRNWLDLDGRMADDQTRLRCRYRADRQPWTCPFGWCARPCDGMEVPTHMWMDVSGPAQNERAATMGSGAAQRRSLCL